MLMAAPVLCAPAPQSQEVVLEASLGAKLAIAVPRPAANGVPEAKVSGDFHAVLARDLAEAGPFSVLKDGLPSATDPASYRLWADAGAEWLLTTAVSATADGIEVVAQVVDVKAGQDKKARTAVFSKRYTGKEAALRRMAHKLSDDLVSRLTGQSGAASTSIVFVRQLSPGIKELFQMDRDGANAVPLTAYRSLTLSPSVAPDGRLAFVTYKGGGPEIWGQRTVGGPMVRLFPTAGKVDGHCFCPVWSPDGRRLALVQGDRRGNTDIIVLDVPTGKVRRLTDSNCLNTDPSWNPTGTQLAFTSDREGSPQIYLMEEDGSNVRRLTREGNYNGSPAWSPGGSMIAYVSRFEGKFDLFVYKLGDGKSYQITTGVASSESPCWSPDERRIIFTSGSRGGMQLYSTDLSGTNLRKLTELSGCQSPKWIRSR
ncbi:protein TolB [Mesoterricola sediminis]|uniref:Protein TolB n=2 Tax=Mesoterricola sediminis TaxID=2927980 RepID=A0AA48KFR0_9BACT|nr:protein TolB [Mesoterricola sediminis]